MEKAIKKRLETIDLCSAEISKSLQTHYELEAEIADAMAFHFVTSEFRLPKKSTSKKFLILCKKLKKWHSACPNLQCLEFVIGSILGVILLISLGIWGLRKLVSPYPKITTVSVGYKFKEPSACVNGVICVDFGAKLAFETQFESIQEGQSVEMIDRDGQKITLERKNGQIILTATEE